MSIDFVLHEINDNLFMQPLWDKYIVIEVPNLILYLISENLKFYSNQDVFIY